MKKLTARILSLGVLAVLVAVFLQAAEKHPFGLDDMAAL